MKKRLSLLIVGFALPLSAELLDHTKVAGPESCGECHSNEVEAWKKTPHSLTFNEMHRRPEAQAIADKLGIRRVRSESLCLQCHYTPMADDAGGTTVIAGVSCESCHGEAKEWINVHNDYGTFKTKEAEPAEHRDERLAKSVAAGMLNPRNLYAVASNCFECHLVPQEKLVNVGGHPAGSPDFELVSWLHGEVRHNFLRTGGKENADNTPERKRVMFVVGNILDLEHSLRGTSLATERGNYAVTLARRAASVRARLADIQSKAPTEEVGAIVEIAHGVKLSLNNGAELSAAADKIADLGRKFADAHDGAALAPIDELIPAAADYLGQAHTL
jgi:hypothetical protein